MIEPQTKSKIERITKVWTPDSKLWVSHNDQELGFAYPSFGPGDYQTVNRELLENGLEVPTEEYIISLIHTAYYDSKVSEEPEFKNIKDLIGHRFICNLWLWIFNQNLWTSEGVYVVQDLDATRINQTLDVNELEEKLKNADKSKDGLRISQDGKVRFAPTGSYRLGRHTSESLVKDGFVRASYGEQGAEKIGEVSTKIKSDPFIKGNPFIMGPDMQKEKLIQTSSGFKKEHGMLFIDGYCSGYGGHAFGVIKQAL